MGLHTELPIELLEVDVIVVGGGSAGCIVAARLSDADPNLSVLLMEEGTNNFNEPTIVYPSFLLSHIAPGAKFVKIHKANKSPELADREAFVPSGSVLGGGSSVNLMLYSRASRSDFDAWETPEWSANELLPYLKKFETFHGNDPTSIHGTDGPIHVSGNRFRSSRLENDFVHAANLVGLPEVEDLNDLSTSNGVTRALRYVDPDGKRQDAGHRFIHPRLDDGDHTNLHVLVEAQVDKVLFNGKKAVGVAYRANPRFQSATDNSDSPIKTVKARKMVILSCGALGTPQVLERSGVGESGVLEKAGVPLVADVPGVGHYYEDHQMMGYPYHSSLEPEETLDSVNSGHQDPTELIQNNDSILGWNSIDAQCKLRPTETEVKALGPAFQKIWDENFKTIADKAMMIMSLVACFPGDPSQVPDGQYFAVVTFSLHPSSRGHIHITGPKLDDPPDFDLGFLADPNGTDLTKLVWAYKKQREIVRRMNVYRGEVAAAHPAFSEESKAACGPRDFPLEPDSDIEYTAEDDAAIEDWIRTRVDTTWHSLGTCKMLPREQFGVVDSKLSVHGVKGLKIADLSIPPSNVGANTNSTAMAIGEKAADIFISELGLNTTL